MKRGFILGIMLMVSIPSFAQWVARYDGGNGDDYASAIAVDDSGYVYVTGWSSGTYFDYTTIKYNSSGDTVWVRRYDGPGNGYDYAKAIVVDDNGGVYVTGESNGSYATIKYNSLGDSLWVKRYDGPGNYEDGASAIAVDKSGYVYVTGWSRGFGTSSDYATIKYNSSGDIVWFRRYNGPGNDSAYAIAVDDSGYIYVTGVSYGSGTGKDYATIKYLCAGVEERKSQVTSYN